MPIDTLRFDSDSWYLNNVRLCTDEADYEDRENAFLEWVEEDFNSSRKCPFCKKLLSTRRKHVDKEVSDRLSVEELEIKRCRNCYFWQGRWHQSDGHCMHGMNDTELKISKLAEFHSDLPAECSLELAQFLRCHPHAWHSYDPRKLEAIIANIFKANFADAEVVHVGRPDDGGVDVLMTEANSRKWLIQVKRRESLGATEGVSTIRNLLGAMVLKRANYGAVVSTVDHFSKRAIEAGQIAGRLGMTVQCIDKGRLNRMLNPILVKAEDEIHQFVRRVKPEWHKHFLEPRTSNHRGRPNDDNSFLNDQGQVKT